MADTFDIDEFIKETNKKSKKNKKLVQNNDFDSISDNDDLYFTVADLLCDKSIDEMQSLPLTCQYINAASIITNMAYASDFETIYTEYAPLIHLAADGLLEVGEPKLSEIMKRANLIYENSKADTASWEELIDMSLWEKVHEEFYAVYDDGKSFLKNAGIYIRKNHKDFYDL